MKEITPQEAVAYLENQIKDIHLGLDYNIYERDKNIQAIQECEEAIAVLQQAIAMIREDYGIGRKEGNL